jgi:hypothetical protein
LEYDLIGQRELGRILPSLQELYLANVGLGNSVLCGNGQLRSRIGSDRSNLVFGELARGLNSIGSSITLSIGRIFSSRPFPQMVGITAVPIPTRV